ncbi:MAG: hypothetical protein IT371_09295 [Deltaproteobacteria bacterium]|nr:hypothetical protein [Deltaproteobacteria bacterium]
MGKLKTSKPGVEISLDPLPRRKARANGNGHGRTSGSNGEVIYHSPGSTGGRKPQVLFICGSLNQTQQMHQVGQQLSDCDCWYTPYYATGIMELWRRLHFQEWSIAGYRWRRVAMNYLVGHDLQLDLHGRRGPYDLVVTCSDLVIPGNLMGAPLVAVQEGILDPENWLYRVCYRFRWLPRWFPGTSMTGLSGVYERFCAASEGYKDHVVARGADPKKVVVTGIPNFDNIERFRDNDFPYKGFVLVCTSDTRETFKRDDRRGFIRRCVEIAKGRQLIFKLHPNERFPRAVREINEEAPGALVYTSGVAEHMIANCEALITQYSSTVFVGMTLGKECHSYFDLDDVRRLMPVQHRSAARKIANVCRELLGLAPVEAAASREDAASRETAPARDDVDGNAPPQPSANRARTARA